MGILGARFDETGINSKDKILVMAGCLAPAPQWGKFERKWKKILREAGLPKGQLFHMNEFMVRKIPPYSEWLKEKHSRVYWDLLSTIKAHSLMISATALNKADYKRFWSKYGYPIPEAHSPISFCATLCLAQMARWTEKNNYRENIAYLFEAGNYPFGEVENVWRAIYGDERLSAKYRAQSVTPQRKEDCISLQAADFVAWEINFHYTLTTQESWPIRKGLQVLMNEVPFEEQLVTYPQLEEKWPSRIEARKHRKARAKKGYSTNPAISSNDHT